IFIYNNSNKNFSEFKKGVEGKTFGTDHWFAAFLEKNKQILEKDMILFDPQYTHIKRNGLGVFHRLKAEVCVPFVVNYRLVGFMFLGKKVNLKHYTLEDLDFLRMLSSPIAIAVNNSITYNMAITDSLTGLYNRNFLFFVLEKEVNKCQRYNSPLSLLFVDLDYLKKLNDVHGHKIGDACLQELAEQIKKATRDSDIGARYGGDEFVVVMPNTGIEGAKAASNRLLTSIKERTLKCNGKKIKFSVSIGVTQYNLQYRDYNQLLVQADKALYKAKARGRNRIELLDI
ncbi:MAG: GGDEF domain-containing protein, partial [Spirochaetes bacterium]|nr:GGDEF domain-containing protein [Spirochaetota bacterium]